MTTAGGCETLPRPVVNLRRVGTRMLAALLLSRCQLVSEGLLPGSGRHQVKLYVVLLVGGLGCSPAYQFVVVSLQFFDVVDFQNFRVAALAQFDDCWNQVFAFVFARLQRLVAIPAEAVLMELYPLGCAAFGVGQPLAFDSQQVVGNFRDAGNLKDGVVRRVFVLGKLDDFQRELFAFRDCGAVVRRRGWLRA